MKIVKKLYAGFFICIFLQAVLIVGCSEGKKNAVSYDQVLQELIADEDTDGDKKITIEDCTFFYEDLVKLFLYSHHSF